jgi:hypothetical protein
MGKRELKKVQKFRSPYTSCVGTSAAADWRPAFVFDLKIFCIESSGV